MLDALQAAQMISYNACNACLQVESHAVLKAYADRISAVFASPLPPAPPPSASQEWASRTEASRSGSRSVESSSPCLGSDL